MCSCVSSSSRCTVNVLERRTVFSVFFFSQHPFRVVFFTKRENIRWFFFLLCASNTTPCREVFAFSTRSTLRSAGAKELSRLRKCENLCAHEARERTVCDSRGRSRRAYITRTYAACTCARCGVGSAFVCLYFLVSFHRQDGFPSQFLEHVHQVFDFIRFVFLLVSPPLHV